MLEIADGCTYVGWDDMVVAAETSVPCLAMVLPSEGMEP